MFFKGSRYRDLTEIGLIDKKGSMKRSKTIRWIPDVSGTFLHTVNQADRLDLISYKYYRDPQKWWHICDANPEFFLPNDLFDNFPMIQEVYDLFYPGEENKWSLLISTLVNSKGIKVAKANVFKKQLYIIYNQVELKQNEIKTMIENEEFEITKILKIERIGQKIIIPQNRIV